MFSSRCHWCQWQISLNLPSAAEEGQLFGAGGGLGWAGARFRHANVAAEARLAGQAPSSPLQEGEGEFAAQGLPFGAAHTLQVLLAGLDGAGAGGTNALAAAGGGPVEAMGPR